MLCGVCGGIAEYFGVDPTVIRLAWVLFSLLGSGGVETTPDMFHPKNTLNYLKTLSGDDNMRKVLSQEFMGLLSAARKVKNQMDADHAALEEAKQ